MHLSPTAARWELLQLLARLLQVREHVRRLLSPLTKNSLFLGPLGLGRDELAVLVADFQTLTKRDELLLDGLKLCPGRGRLLGKATVLTEAIMRRADLRCEIGEFRADRLELRLNRKVNEPS